MSLLWLLVGFVVGAAVVWVVIKRKVDEQTAASEANFDSRLRHLQAEVGRADQAHEETKVQLREMLADRNAATQRADRLAEEVTAARRETATAQARGTRLDDEVAAARNRVDRLTAELARSQERGQELEARVTQTKVLVDELEARIGSMAAAASTTPHSNGAPLAAGPASMDGAIEDGAATTDPGEATARLKAIEARLAALPVGTSAHTALTQERDELLRATGGDLPLPGMLPVAEEAPTIVAATKSAGDATAQRVKAIDAKLKMLPAGSSARTALQAEKTRLQDAAGTI